MALLDEGTNPEELRRPSVPEGFYKGIIIKCIPDVYPDDHPFPPFQGCRYVKWQFRIDDADAPEGINGQAVFEETIYEASKGDKFLNFVMALGFEPKEFDAEDATNVACKARITERHYKKKDGNPGVRNGIGMLMAD